MKPCSLVKGLNNSFILKYTLYFIYIYIYVIYKYSIPPIISFPVLSLGPGLSILFLRRLIFSFPFAKIFLIYEVISLLMNAVLHKAGGIFRECEWLKMNL